MRSSRPLIIAVHHRARPLFDFHSQGSVRAITLQLDPAGGEQRPDITRGDYEDAFSVGVYCAPVIP
jgi:hypothetical protein